MLGDLSFVGICFCSEIVHHLRVKLLGALSLLTEKNRLVDGTPTSIAGLGYNRLGIDDGWQACHTGVNMSSYHDEHGKPLVNHKRFANSC